MKILPVYLGLGSNLGDRQAYLQRARQFLQTINQGRWQQSSVYESAAMGGEASAGAYLNQVVSLETDLRAVDLLHTLKGFERLCGRRPRGFWMSREIDMDILIYGSLILKEGRFQIPHSGLHLRQFMLKPLVEINPEIFHPKLSQTVAKLLSELVESQGEESLPKVDTIEQTGLFGS